MKKIIFVLVTLGVIFCLPVLAADSWFQLVPEECTSTPQGDCNLNSVLKMVINFSRLILMVSGSAALLMFTYGGVQWIIAAGNQEKIQQGKAALIAASIGLAIILSAWLIVNTTICALTKGTVGCEGQLFGSTPWNTPSGN